MRFLRSLFPHTLISSWNLPPWHHITKSLPTQYIPAIKCNFKVTRVSHLYFSNTMKWTHRPQISLNIYIFSHKAPCPRFFPSTSFWISSFSPLSFFPVVCYKIQKVRFSRTVVETSLSRPSLDPVNNLTHYSVTTDPYYFRYLKNIHLFVINRVQTTWTWTFVPGVNDF